MPPKIRELEIKLKRNGFVNKGGKGSHRNYEHPAGIIVGISGHSGADAKPYQEKEVAQAIERSKENE